MTARFFTIWRLGAPLMVRQAIRFGRLVKPDCCSICGATGVQIAGHHDDYMKPLDVRWLCESCHRAWHRANGPGLHSFEVEVTT